MPDLRPVERAVYIHHLVGGPHDGQTLAASHRYDTLTFGGIVEYAWDGDEPTPCDPGGWEWFSGTDNYTDPVYLRVTMRPARVAVERELG